MSGGLTSTGVAGGQRQSMKIGIVNASSRFSKARAEAVLDWFATNFPDGSVNASFHPASFGKHGHFGGDDASRANAFVEYANDPRLDAVWFARGGYGSCRIAEAVLPRLTAVARKKRYLGYSDAGPR
jgi:muramoyltetrapeptide carboxypeptidase